MKVTLNISGDFYLESENVLEDIVDKRILTHFEQADLNIVNLECPVLEDESIRPIIKTGPNIFNTPKIKSVLGQLNIHGVTLANNHIMDFGSDGLNQTLDFCDSNAIHAVGANKDLSTARKPLKIEKNGLVISILNFAENEWASASQISAGANPFNLINNVKDIRKARETSDKVIVVFHGGHEYNHLPSPFMQENLRFFADEGADLIVCHHAHAISGYEVHNGVPIFYGLGNFLFTMPSQHESWYTGLVLKVSMSKDELTWELIPVIQEKETFKLGIFEDEAKERVLNQIQDLNDIISDPKALQDNWDNFVKKKTHYYGKVLRPEFAIEHKRLLKYFPYLNAAYKKFFGKYSLNHERYYSYLLNHLRCESHRELSIEVLENILAKKKK